MELNKPAIIVASFPSKIDGSATDRKLPIAKQSSHFSSQHGFMILDYILIRIVLELLFNASYVVPFFAIARSFPGYNEHFDLVTIRSIAKKVNNGIKTISRKK